MVRSTFAGFTTAQLALSASQRALDVTGQNISNVNTAGYTRQRLDLASISPTGHSYFQMQTDCRVGQGVQMTGIIQIRDPFLDIQYRNQLAKVGTIDAQDSVLSDIGDIFDEVDSEGVRAALNDVVKQLNNMAKPDGANQGASDTLVRSAMEVLLTIIHEKASDLKNVQTELIDKLQTTDIENINSYLDSISKLNESIKNSQILGSPALELQDQRNQLIDELATYLPISVTYEDLDLGSGIKVDTLKIDFSYKDANGNTQTLTLVDDVKHGSFEFKANPNADIAKGEKVGSLSITDVDGTKVDVTDSLGNGVLKGALDMLNKAGSFDGSDVKGIDYYEELFDSFVNTFATTLNKLNKEAGGGALFTTLDGKEDGSFTATDIKISDKWMSGEVKIVTTKPEDPNNPNENSTAYENVLAMINAITTDQLKFTSVHYKDNGQDIIAFEGNCFDAYDNLQKTQAIERKSSDSILNNRLSVLNQIANSKDAVSGVYMDEEVMNLMRYQQSYNAAARLMTTLDEALNTLINNTGIVGR